MDTYKIYHKMNANYESTVCGKSTDNSGSIIKTMCVPLHPAKSAPCLSTVSKV